jgi:hypothetical protein
MGRLSLAWPQPQKRAKGKCSTAAFPTLFMFIKVGAQVSLVTMSHPFPELLLHLLAYHWKHLYSLYNKIRNKGKIVSAGY